MNRSMQIFTLLLTGFTLASTSSLALEVSEIPRENRTTPFSQQEHKMSLPARVNEPVPLEFAQALKTKKPKRAKRKTYEPIPIRKRIDKSSPLANAIKIKKAGVALLGQPMATGKN